MIDAVLRFIQTDLPDGDLNPAAPQDESHKWASSITPDTAKVATSLFISHTVTKWRNDTLTSDSCLLVKVVVWIAAEAAFVFNVCISMIEFIVRGALALLIVLPLKLYDYLKHENHSANNKTFRHMECALHVGAISMLDVVFNLNPFRSLRSSAEGRLTTFC